jgi:hypothetical protein
LEADAYSLGLALFAALVIGALALSPVVRADPGGVIKIGRLSQQMGSGRAQVGASISVRRAEPGREAQQPQSQRINIVVRRAPGSAGADLPVRYPALPVNSALARNPQPFGPGSFWYPIGSGRVCMYAPDSVLPCFTLVGAGSKAAGPGLNPGAIAASVADRLSLAPGRIDASPRLRGLTGAASWFWLDPAPSTEELTVSLAGETVTVSADPATIEWQFGDGTSLAGGPGRPYEPGAPPAGAVVRVYQTRCLPGDQGRNPYVLAGCGSTGYPVGATIVWQITFSARGPVNATGALPTRTTATSITYPVSEARGFLISGSSK